MTPGTGEERTGRATVTVRGHVQGVGFRWWARAHAQQLGLCGHARNLDDGSVEVLLQGPATAVDAMVRLLEEKPSTSYRPGRVAGSVCRYGQPQEGLTGFVER